MRRLVILFAVLALAGCGGQARQDADEPDGTFRLEVVDASFPERQQLAEPVEFKLSVRNTDDETLRNVAVTEGDKVEAELRFGMSVNTWGVNDLVAVVEAVQKTAVEDLVEENEAYWVVVKTGEAGEYVEHLDPRGRAR